MKTTFLNILCGLCAAIVAIVGEVYPILEYKNAFLCHRTKVRWDSQSSGQSGPPTWTEKITPYPDQLSVRPDPSKGEGCYRLQAKVLVRERISSPFQLRLTLRLGGIKSTPLPCSRDKSDPSDCSKGWGSCIYCDLCSALSSTSVILNGNNEVLSCPLKKGAHSIVYNFCLPPISEFARDLPPDIAKIIELEDKNFEDKDTASKDLYMQLEFYDKDIHAECGTAQRPDDCTLDPGSTMIGCVNVFSKVKVNLGELGIHNSESTQQENPDEEQDHSE